MRLASTRKTLLFSFLAAILVTGCSSEEAGTNDQQETDQAAQEEPNDSNENTPDGQGEEEQANEENPADDEEQSNQDHEEEQTDSDDQQTEEEQNEEDSSQDLSKEEAAEVLQEYENTFMVKTSTDGTVENYGTKEELLSHFKTIMSQELAQNYVDDFFRMDNGQLKMVATEPPVWLDPENDYQLNKQNESTYHVVQSKSSELRGDREYTFQLAYKNGQWIVDEVSSAKSGEVTKREAEESVRNHLGNDITESTIVEYDHMEQNQYVIHVYDQIEDEEGSHTATYGWYKVDPATGEITSLFGDDEQTSRSQQIKEKADNVLDALLNKDMDTLASYVHQEKGLLISPYVNISDEDVVFEQEQVANLFEMKETYTWGYQDGSGKPMKSTPQEYFQRYQDFAEVDKVIVDDLKQRGNVQMNIKEYFPESHVVEFYKNGTEENSNMDWSSLYIVFQKNSEGEWKAVALVSGQWTI
ncbi:hypothetical protein ACOJQI_03245 [Bacillus salacetis]|uniref:hypothetical protein n=1 Tax=Bacillus salacetis TaxID=2315464 RepID=UPI003BA3B89E